MEEGAVVVVGVMTVAVQEVLEVEMIIVVSDGD